MSVTCRQSGQLNSSERGMKRQSGNLTLSPSGCVTSGKSPLFFRTSVFSSIKQELNWMFGFPSSTQLSTFGCLHFSRRENQSRAWGPSGEEGWLTVSDRSCLQSPGVLILPSCQQPPHHCQLWCVWNLFCVGSHWELRACFHICGFSHDFLSHGNLVVFGYCGLSFKAMMLPVLLAASSFSVLFQWEWTWKLSEWKPHGEESWSGVEALSLIHWVNSGRPFILFGSWFPHLLNQDKNSCLSHSIQVFWRCRGLTDVKCFNLANCMYWHGVRFWIPLHSSLDTSW